MESKIDVSLRKNYRGQLTKLCKSVDETVNLKETLPDDLSVLCEKIKLLRLTLNDLNAKILPTLSDDLIETECDKVAEYDISAMDAIASLEVSIKCRTCGNQPQNVGRGYLRAPEGVSDISPNQERDIGNVQTQINQKSVRLPKLDLLKFNGDLEAWPAFWEQFSQAIHNNPELSINCKFTYLKSLLTGKAAVTISGLTSSQNSYNDAIELIKSEYGQSERIIDCYVQKLCGIPSVKYDKDVSALRRLYNTASSITCSLESLGISADQYGLMVKSMIFKVLPYSLRVQFNRIKIQSVANETQILNGSETGSVNLEPDSLNYNKQIANLLNFIKIEVDALEQAQSNENKDNKFNASSLEKFGHSTRTEPRNRFKSNSNERFTAQGLLSVANDQCLFCKNKNHTTKNCLNTVISLADKKKLLKDSNRCFRCTGQNHRSKFCKTRDITCKKCKGRHVTALCDPSFKPRNKTIQNEQNDRSNNEQSVTVFSNGRLENVYLQTACVFVKSNENNNEIFLRAVFDAGSQLTYIKQCVSRELDLPIIGKHKISVCVFGSSQRGVAKLCNKVKLVVRSQYSNKLITIHAIEAPEICFDSIKPPCLTDPVIEKFAKHNPLADMRTMPLNSTGISLLIGSENYWLLVTGETRPLTDKLRAINTKVGWTIHGARECNDAAPDFSVNFNVATILHLQLTESDIETDFNENDNINLKRFWDLETIGISGSEVKIKDNFTDNFMKNNVNFKNNRYEVTLPWQSDNILDSNYSGAFVRVKNLVNKLCKNGTLLEYDRAIREYERLGCLEVVNENEINHDKKYYLPHRPVYRRDKETSQVRVVFDASAHAPGMPSLNDKLITGENLVPDLLKILLNFRIGSVGLVADIEKAFLQISLCNEDRDYHRFLWFKDPIENEISSVEQLPKFDTFRMCRVTFGITTSPFLLAVTLRKHLLNQPDREFGKYLLESFYIDDFIKSVDNENAALKIYERSKNILSEANMNLRKWCSNNLNLTKAFNNPIENDTNHLKSNDPKKVLGINWFTVTDQLAVDIPRIFKHFDVSKEPTKRIILQTIGKVFDPIGVLSGCTVTIKILLQKIWKKNLKWDEPLPNEFKMEWNQWINDVSNLNDYAIPRCILSDRKDPVELHIFADASSQAYGAVAYLKSLDNNACNFFMSKNRVAPLNQTLTLPKLELTAALCGARLQKYITENIELNIIKKFIWSDSKITLHWINGNKYKWKPFIQNRVQEIRNMNNITWKYCPGKENPADLLTRGMQASKLLKESERWLHGPTWLSSNKENWPMDEYFDLKNEETTVFSCLAETRAEIDVENNEKATLKKIFHLDQFSNYEKALRVTVFIKRFLYNVKIRKMARRILGYIRTKEMEKAETYWIRIAQEEMYLDEIKSLRKNKEISRKSEILKLNPFIDENHILRLKGRLQESCLNYNERHPIILPKNSELAKKLIWNAHEKMKHSGINSTLAEIRKKYWIIQARQKIKGIIGRCVVCKKLKGKSGMQPFAPLPRDRITTAQPFNVTGIDFAGPLYIIKNEQRIKVYIMLFTCAVIRAVHLELVENLSTESCVLGLRRFIARRGVPNIIYSDNAKTFKRTALELDELTKILQQEEIQNLARKNRIHWKFSVERGSWWGGFWERLVRTVKSSLKSTLLKKLVGFDELRTILAEVEATVNSRPLTYIDDDPENLFILTPGKFLIGEGDLGFSMNLKSVEIKRNDVLKIWKNREETMNQFWKKWQVDYLQQLRSAYYVDNPKSKDIQVGNLVLLQDQDRPRLTWKLVRVTQVFQGRDGKVRACEIKTSNGDKLRRPVQCLYPLEIDSFVAGEDVENSSALKNRLEPGKNCDKTFDDKLVRSDHKVNA